MEEREIAAGNTWIAGVDEAGRGPWAGPVVAAAVILDARSIPDGIDDSKALTAERRSLIYDAIVASGALVSVGIACVDRIDRINILNATLWAMQLAVSKLPKPPDVALIDGNRAPRLSCQTHTVVSGDASSLSIAAASIIAKVTRDRLMIELAARHPDYGFERHKGYGTPEHMIALDRHGVTAHHRRSFKPIQLIIDR